MKQHSFFGFQFKEATFLTSAVFTSKQVVVNISSQLCDEISLIELMCIVFGSNENRI